MYFALVNCLSQYMAFGDILLSLRTTIYCKQMVARIGLWTAEFDCSLRLHAALPHHVHLETCRRYIYSNYIGAYSYLHYITLPVPEIYPYYFRKYNIAYILEYFVVTG